MTISDLEARWRPLSSAENDVAGSLLSDAWEILLARVPSLNDRLLSGSLSQGLVVAAVTAMVLRVLRNPEGKRMESIDDYSWTRDNAVSAGLLYASDDELRLLSGVRRGAFSIAPGF